MTERWQGRVSGSVPRPAYVYEDNSSRAWTELAEIVACRVRTDLGIDGEGSSRSYADGGMVNDGEDHVSKSRTVQKRRLHKQKQRANVTAKLESFEDLEAPMDHMESLIKGHFNEDPGRAMTRAECETIAVDSAKKASDARELRVVYLPIVFTKKTARNIHNCSINSYDTEISWCIAACHRRAPDSIYEYA